MRTPRSTARLLRRAYASEFLFGLCMGVWSISFNFHLSYLGYGDTAIGWMLSVGYLVTAVSAFFVGQLGDAVGFPYVAALGALLSGASLLLLAACGAPAAVWLSRVMYSAGYGCVMSMEFTLPISIAPVEQKQPIYNRILVLYQFGSIIGSLLCGWGADLLARRLDNPYAPLNALIGVFYLLICLMRARMPRQTAGRRKIELHTYLDCLKNRQILSFLLYGLLTLGLFALTTSFMNLILRYRYGASDGIVGTSLSVFALSGCLALAVLPVLTRRFTLSRITVAALAVQAAVILALTQANLGVFIALFTVRTVTCNILYTSADGPMLRSIPQERQGTYSGMRIFANNLGMSIALAFAGWVIDQRWFAALFLISAAVALLQNLTYHGLCLRYVRQE